MTEHMGGFFLFVSRQSKPRYVENLESSAFRQNMYRKSLLCKKLGKKLWIRGFHVAQSVKVTFIRVLGLVFLFNEIST